MKGNLFYIDEQRDQEQEDDEERRRATPGSIKVIHFGVV